MEGIETNAEQVITPETPTKRIQIRTYGKEKKVSKLRAEMGFFFLPYLIFGEGLADCICV